MVAISGGAGRTHTRRPRGTGARARSAAATRVELPWDEGKSLPGWLHLPCGASASTPVGCVIALGGMDSAKELLVNLDGDPLLQRGLAVLALDGPGQASDIGLAACAVASPCQETGGPAIFGEASPTFKTRFMYMPDYADEAAFDAAVSDLVTVEGCGPRIGCPYLGATLQGGQRAPLARAATNAWNWLGSRDHGDGALRRAARAAIITPGTFALCLKVIGNPQSALFAAFGSVATLVLIDHPFESMAAASDWFDRAPLSDDEREKISSGNATRLFGL